MIAPVGRTENYPEITDTELVAAVQQRIPGAELLPEPVHGRRAQKAGHFQLPDGRKVVAKISFVHAGSPHEVFLARSREHQQAQQKGAPFPEMLELKENCFEFEQRNSDFKYPLTITTAPEGKSASEFLDLAGRHGTLSKPESDALKNIGRALAETHGVKARSFGNPVTGVERIPAEGPEGEPEATTWSEFVARRLKASLEILRQHDELPADDPAFEAWARVENLLKELEDTSIEPVTVHTDIHPPKINMGPQGVTFTAPDDVARMDPVVDFHKTFWYVIDPQWQPSGNADSLAQEKLAVQRAHALGQGYGKLPENFDQRLQVAVGMELIRTYAEWISRTQAPPERRADFLNRYRQRLTEYKHGNYPNPRVVKAFIQTANQRTPARTRTAVGIDVAPTRSRRKPPKR